MSGGHADWNQQIIDTFRANAGEVPQFGRSLVLVHHVGAKSGLERVSPVMALRDGDDTWLMTNTPCDWYGITCAVRGGQLHVAGIDMSGGPRVNGTSTGDNHECGRGAARGFK